MVEGIHEHSHSDHMCGILLLLWFEFSLVSYANFMNADAKQALKH